MTADKVSICKGFQSVPYGYYTKGNLIIEKYDSVTKQPLAGARFKVTNANGELTPDNEGLTSSNGLYTTDQSGQIILSKLLPDTYIVSEERSPDNYQADPTPQTVVVNAGDTQTLRFVRFVP